MAAVPATSNEFLDLLAKSGIVSTADLSRVKNLPDDPKQCAAALIGQGLITKYQAKLLLDGRFKGFKLGAYLIREQIGQGGMGTVYLAEHETLKRRVALKVLSLKKDGNNTLTIERFLREARSAAALDHPNIVRLHDVGKSGDTHYIVMEFVEGQTLDQMITGGGSIAASRAVEYIAMAAAGLQHAFEKGFIHRDIKPANLMLAKDGTIKILDMGLARATETADQDKLTEILDKGAVVGTADFISPEQAMNGKLDIRSDIYSLGATFYALVTGQPPFSGNTTQKLIQHQMKEAPSLMTIDRTFPPGLSAILTKMLAKRAEQRFQTPGDLIQALAEWIPQQASGKMSAAISGTDIANSEEMQSTLSEIATGTRRLASKPRLNPEPAQRTKWLWPAVAAGVLLLIGGIAAAVLSGGNDPKVETPVAAVGPQPTPHTPTPTSTEVTQPVTVSARKEMIRPVIYQPDFRNQKPFVERGRNITAGTGARKWVVDEKHGTGVLPANWQITTLKAGSVAESAIRFVEERPVIGFRSVSGGPTLLLKSSTFTTRTGKIFVSLEYNAPSPDSVPHFKFMQETPARKLVGEIRNTRMTGEDEWVTVTKEFEVAAGAAGWIECHQSGKGSESMWIRNFQVLQGGNPAEIPSRDVPLYAVNFSQCTVGKDRYENTIRPFYMYSLGGKDLLSSMAIQSHKLKITSEYSFADVDGVRALGLQQFEGSAGTQMHFSLNDTHDVLKPGEVINIRIVYRFDGTGNGAACMENKKDRKIKNGRWLLTPTDGQWRTVEFPFTRLADEMPYDLIINAGNNEQEPRAQGVIWIKSVEVKYADAK